MTLFKVNSNGVITVDTSEIKSTLEDAYKNALGSNLNLDASTPQGQLIQSETAIIEEIQTDLVSLANAFNVYTAEDDALDSAGSFFGYYRKINQPTVVIATLQGSPNTVIPAGSKASNGNYDFESLDNITIPASGIIQAEFQCTTMGAIPCVAGTLNTIVSTITGWDSINNTTNGVVGYSTETDNEFRARITANWLNIRAVSLLGAIIDNVAQLDGVISVIGRENPDGQVKVVDGLTLQPHSIWLTVLGGNQSEIAEVLTKKKTLGAFTNGDTIIKYYDDISQYTYLYRIKRPDVESLFIQVNYEKNVYTPAEVESSIISLIMQFIESNPIKIGQLITGNWLAEAFDGYNQINLLSVKVKLAEADEWADYVNLSLEQIASVSSITAVEV